MLILLVDIAGYRTTSGRKRNDALFPVLDKSDWPVQKWEEAGGIVLGKLNMHEIGADTTNNNPNWGTPKNPHNDQYYTGGSSGGAAYAVSSGLIPVALGTDGGGSIRIPASFCGIYGLKPSHARLGHGGSTVTVAGPLAASIADLEAAYRFLLQADPSDTTAALFAPPGPISGSHPKVIGIYRTWFDRADPSVLSVCSPAIDYFRDRLGYTVVDIELPYVPEGQSKQ
jgi:Asp-tRNA(Asn)/Glu-tRNA(Gln) amidotransferase A subunit family amidase